MNCAALTVVNVPVGSNAVYHFVWKDSDEQPVDLAGCDFIITTQCPAVTLKFDTTVDTSVLFIEEGATIEPADKPSYVADRLVFAMTPVITRQIPLGALTKWEIERRKDGDQRNWGIGMFSGYGGVNPDA